MQKEIYLVPEFCQLFSISRTAFYREMKAGRLKTILRGRRRGVERTESQRWLASLRQPSSKQSA